MRIGIDARLWNETGVGRYIRNLVSNLSEIDKKNEYVLFMRSKYIKDGKWKMENGKWKIVEADIRWHTIDEQLKLPQILNKENLDLMHFPYFSVPVKYNRPFVMTIHDLIINHFPTGKASTLPIPLYQFKRLGYKYVLSNAIKNAKKIIVPLNAVKDDLLKSYKIQEDKIIVTYEGVDESLSSSSEQSESRSKILKQVQDDKFSTGSNNKYFLYVGNAYPHKNLERLIKAFSVFRKDGNEDTQLLLVGKDDYFYKKLNEKIKKENYKNILIRNNVTDRELANYYRTAIALISPSLMEGFGLPALEAMASKCLILASSIPSLKEVCVDAAVYFDPYSIRDLTEKMKYISELDLLTKDEFTKRGLKRSGEFSWKRMAEQTLQVYNSVKTT